MSALADFRDYVAGVCQTATGITIVPGRFNGPLQGFDKGCAYMIGKAEDTTDVAQVRYEVRVRLFKDIQPFDGDDPEDKPRDDSALVALAELCEVAASASGVDETAGDSVWYYRLTEYEVNLDQYGVEMAFMAYADNKFAVLDPMP